MALDPMAQELVNETMTALQAAKFGQNVQLNISPRRMRALILWTQQRMLMSFHGKTITLVEDNDAPELSAVIAEALAAQPPELPEPVVPPEPEPEPRAPSKTIGQHKAERKNGKHAR
jgi:hypothetical protein